MLETPILVSVNIQPVLLVSPPKITKTVSNLERVLLAIDILLLFRTNKMQNLLRILDPFVLNLSRRWIRMLRKRERILIRLR
jgi:hypothetical protein